MKDHAFLGLAQDAWKTVNESEINTNYQQQEPSRALANYFRGNPWSTKQPKNIHKMGCYNPTTGHINR